LLACLLASFLLSSSFADFAISSLSHFVCSSLSHARSHEPCSV
jgi:hypothetical protein